LCPVYGIILHNTKRVHPEVRNAKAPAHDDGINDRLREKFKLDAANMVWEIFLGGLLDAVEVGPPAVAKSCVGRRLVRFEKMNVIWLFEGSNT
jgi:hypothetical protein